MSQNVVCCGPDPSITFEIITSSHGDWRHWADIGCCAVGSDAIWRPLCCGRRDGVTNDPRGLFTSLGAQGERPLRRHRLLLRVLPSSFITPIIPVVSHRKSLHSWFSGAQRYSTSSTNSLHSWLALT